MVIGGAPARRASTSVRGADAARRRNTDSAPCTGQAKLRLRQRPDARKLIDQTGCGRGGEWSSGLDCEGSQADLMKRSALTLKLLDHAETGAIMAAATSSLPEWPGSPRNWDYRYTWVRDASFSNYVFRRIGDPSDADVFLAWVLTNVERDGGPAHYVRTGRFAAAGGSGRSGAAGLPAVPHRCAGVTAQSTNCSMMSTVKSWTSPTSGPTAARRVDKQLWAALTPIVEACRSAAGRRSGQRPLGSPHAGPSVHILGGAFATWPLTGPSGSPASTGCPYPKRRWETTAREIRASRAGTQSWNPERRTLTEHLGRQRAAWMPALLTLPIRNVIDFDDPRMVATTRAIAAELDAGNGLLFRYLPQVSPDGLPGGEGAFLLCSFWLVDNLAGQGTSGGGPRTVRVPVQPCQPARIASRTDPPRYRGIPRKLPAGVQPRGRAGQRTAAAEGPAEGHKKPTPFMRVDQS